ncbi:MAG: NAD(P)-dependent oxidoreductase, partial [Mycobacterium sp.]|nr:NAD(P)-dependent oxidoreductase [Mycobacterium sp.]
MSEPKLGYIGLGNQGAPMAKRLVDWPGGLVVFDVRADAMT